MMPRLRIVLRGLARAPLFTGVAIVSLALGIGANTAIFSLLYQLVLRVLPVKNPHELVYLYHPGPVQGSMWSDEAGGPSFSYPMFQELQKEQTPFTGLAAARSQSASLSYGNAALPGNIRLVSGNYFELLGVRSALGRLFSEDDNRTPGAHPVAILSHAYWTSRFGNDVSVLNRDIIVNGYPLTIVGVAQKGFFSEKLGEVPDVYVPVCMKKEVTAEFEGLTDRKFYWLSLVGRLKPGMTRERAEAAINAAYRGQLEQDIALLRQPKKDFLEHFRAKKIILKPGEHGRGGLREESSKPLTLLMGMAVLVLLIACANVANLQLARSAGRSREIAVRLAMGASRMELIRQLLSESCLLSLAGGALGLAAGKWTIRAIQASLPGFTGMPTFLTDTLDARVLLFSLGLSLATGILFGLFPALQASKTDLVSSLKDQAGQISSTGAANVFRKTLVTAQVGVSLALLISAGLFGKTLVNLTRIDLGVRIDHLMTFSLLPKQNKYNDQRVANFHQQLTERLAALPGVMLVSSSQVPAIANWSSSTSIAVEGYPATEDSRPQSNLNVVDAGYFRTMEVPLVSGREFTLADTTAGPKVAVVNQTFVRKFLPGVNPLGRHIGNSDSGTDIEIVGVVKDAKYADMRQAPPPVFYTPLRQQKRWNMIFFYLRTATEPQHTGALIRREVAALDPNLPVRELKTMQAQIDENIFAERILSRLTAIFAGLAMLLAAVGLYGVLAYNVARRTREIGIRMALGADGARVRGLIAREVGMMLAIGTAAGAGLAAACGRLMQSFLYGMKPWDGWVYAISALLLWAIAIGAAYVPSRRATAVDPMVALRYE